MSEDGRTSPCGSELPLEVCNDLQCPICLEFFRHPIILPCSHVLCRSPCAENLFDFNFIRCPVCRENCYISGGVGSLPRVIVLESIIDKYRSERLKAVKNASSSSQKHRASVPVSVLSQHRDNSSQSNAACILSPSTIPTPLTSDNAITVSANASITENDILGRSTVLSSQSTQRQCCEPSISGSGFIDSVLSHTSSNGSETLRGNANQHLTSLPTSGSSHNRLVVSSQVIPGNGNSRVVPSQTASLSHNLNTSGTSTSALALCLPSPRSVALLDSVLSLPVSDGNRDANTTSVTSCACHGNDEAVYCQVCEECMCEMCGTSAHLPSHQTCSLEEAAAQAKNKLIHTLDKMIHSQIKVVSSLEQQRQRLKDMEQLLTRKNEEINMQCDSLLAEVEHKRSLFLTDLEQEERMRRHQADDVIDIFEKILGASQNLACYVKTVMEKDAVTLLQVTPELNEQLLGSIIDCEACQLHPQEHHVDLAPGKVVDLRKEQALLRDIHYLHPPAAPLIDLPRCVRSDSTVALFLVPPRGSDVIDTFVIRYCSHEQKTLGIEETLNFDHHEVITANGGGTGAGGEQSSGCLLSYVALVEPLRTATTYLFCLSAANSAGPSANSEVVQCVTLTPTESVVPVPVILESMCQTYPSSIRVFTPSPHDVAPQQNISHFLLYRPHHRQSLWRSVALCGLPEHRVFGLEPETQYDFVVMATNPRGECQLSARLVLETARLSS